MVAEPVGSTDGTQRYRCKAAHDRRVERGSLRRQQEPCQVGSLKLLERSECGRPATLKKEKEINALSHGYSRADCRGNERDAASDRGVGSPAGGGTQQERKSQPSGRLNKHISQSQDWWIQGVQVVRRTSAAATRRAWRRVSQFGKGKCRTTS